MIDQLSAAADCHHQKTQEASLGPPWPMIIHASKRWDRGLESSRIVACSAVRSLHFQYFLNILVSSFIIQISCPQMMWIIATAAVHRVLVSLEKWVVLMGGAINCSFISAYFLTVQTYKRMRLIPQVYGNYILIYTSRGVATCTVQYSLWQFSNMHKILNHAHFCCPFLLPILRHRIVKLAS